MPFRKNPQDIVHVKVETQDFAIHKFLICSESRYFDRAFNNTSFVEATTGVLVLPDVEVDVFRLLFSWLYTRQVNSTEKEDKDGKGTSSIGVLVRLSVYPAISSLKTKLCAAY